MSLIDQHRLQAVVGSIPSGRWAAYGDVARVCGGTDAHARTLNQRFIRDPLPGAHRVLMGTGAVSANALGDPGRVRAQLEGGACASSTARPPPRRESRWASWRARAVAVLRPRARCPTVS